MYVSVWACGCQKRVSDVQELEIRVVVICLTWVSGTEIGSFTEAASALNHWANCPSFPLRHLSSPFLFFSVKVRLPHLQVSRLAHLQVSRLAHLQVSRLAHPAGI